MKVETPVLVPRAALCDLQITAVDLVQTVQDVDFVVPARPVVMRVRVASTFDSDIVTELECHVNDLVGPEMVRRYPITIPACGPERPTATVDASYLVEDPVTIDRRAILVI